MTEKTEEEKVRELAAAQLTGFMRWLSVAQLRLRCAEIIFTAGSQVDRLALESQAERLYKFAVTAPDQGIKKIDKETHQV